MILDIREYGVNINQNTVHQIIAQVHALNTTQVANTQAKVIFPIEKLFVTLSQAQHLFNNRGRIWHTYEGIEICIKEDPHQIDLPRPSENDAVRGTTYTRR